MGCSWCRRLPRSRLPSPVRQDGAPECEVGASPHIPWGCVVEPMDEHIIQRAGGLSAPAPYDPGDTMTTPVPTTRFADPAPAERLEKAATALTANGFAVEILDDAAAARTRVKDLI